MRASLLALALLASLGTTACLGTTPEEAERRALGRGDRCDRGEDDDDEGGATHRPGQPCLICHADRFFLAGTVYRLATDTCGIGNVDVHITDALGREVSARTNRTGNFMVARPGGEGEDGAVRLSFKPEYPLEVWIEDGATQQVMRSRIYREGSCSTCHTRDPGAASPGRVFLQEAP